MLKSREDRVQTLGMLRKMTHHYPESPLQKRLLQFLQMTPWGCGRSRCIACCLCGFSCMHDGSTQSEEEVILAHSLRRAQFVITWCPVPLHSIPVARA